MSRVLFLCVASALWVAPVPVAAQANDAATLRVTVLDETGAALIHAQVVTIDPSGFERTVRVDGRGVAVLDALAAGAVQLRVEAEGFAAVPVAITLRRGSNETTVRLPVAIREEIQVSEQSADGRRDNGFTTTLTQEEIDTLSDDPDEMAEQLAQMAGPGAQIFVDGFNGGRLPPKDQIQQIRFNRNSFSAEYHQAGQVRVEIISRPGMGGWRGNFNAGFRDESFNARNPFAAVRGPEQQRRFMLNFQGPLARGKTGLSVSVDGNSAYDSRTIVAFTPSTPVNEQVRRPVDSLNTTLRVEHALGPGNSLRAEYQRRFDSRRNLGVGDFDLFDRAYETEAETHQLRVRNTRVLGRTAFSELRVELSSNEASTNSASDAPAVRVLEAFTSGGAGRTGTRTGRELEVAQNVDFTIGKQSWRAGLLLEAGWWDSTQQSNVNGTFTFQTLEAFQQRLATTYTRIVGNPEVSYSQLQAGWFAQNDIRLHRNFSLSLGLRQEIQTHVDDKWNLAPRLAFTWNAGKAAVRGGYGLFYDWFEANTYEQTIRLDGTRQIEGIVLDPTYPDASGLTGTSLPPSLVRAAAALTQPRLQQASIGIERPFTEWMSGRADFLWTRGSETLRSVNINAPGVDGVRPNPAAGNITEIQSRGRTAQDRLSIGINLRVPNRRVFGNVMYQLASLRNFADSPLSLPSNSNDPDADWGPAAQDVRHRLFLMANMPVAYGVRAGVNIQASSTLPYNITTGRDENGDTVFNDRPAGVTRNSARGAGQWNVNLRLNRAFGFGGLRGGAGGGPMGSGPGGPPPSNQRGPGGGPGGGGGGPQMVVMEGANARYRLDFYAQASNLLNSTNENAFVGNLLSPVFGRATSAGPSRRIELGLNFGF